MLNPDRASACLFLRASKSGERRTRPFLADGATLVPRAAADTGLEDVSASELCLDVQDLHFKIHLHNLTGGRDPQ